PSERVLLRLDDQEFLGPVRLIPNHSGLLTVEVTRNGQPVPPFSLHSIAPERLIQLDCDGNRRTFVSAGINLGAPQSQVDWSPEELILKRVLRHARETENGNLPDLTNKLVDAIAKILSEVGSPLEHYRVQRASRILLNAQSVERVLPIITNEILSLPKVKT